MCVIVVKPAGVKLKKAYWAECFRMNGHGAGLSYVEDNKLVVDKGYFVFDELYAEIEKLEEKEMVVHFRVSSAGAINVDNCHPFFIESVNFPRYSWAISHNGTLDYRSTQDESDTNLFVNEVLGPQLDMHPWFLDEHPGQHLLKAACRARFAAGNDSKMVVFRYDNEKKESKIYITNKFLGTEEMGCWFSNTSFRLPVVYHGYMNRGYLDHMGDYSGGDESFLELDDGFTSEKDWSRHGFHLNGAGKWQRNIHRVVQVRQSNILPPLPPLATKQEQQKTNAALALSDSSGSNKIVVPRDDEIKAARDKEVYFNSRLNHLSKKAKKILRRMACDYAKATLTAEAYAKMKVYDYVQDFRDVVRYRSDGGDLILMEDKALDEWIIDQHFKCQEDKTLDLQHQLGLDYEHDPEITSSNDPRIDDLDGPDDIDEAVAYDAKLGHNVERFPEQNFPLGAGHGDPINI